MIRIGSYKNYFSKTYNLIFSWVTGKLFNENRAIIEAARLSVKQSNSKLYES